MWGCRMIAVRENYGYSRKTRQDSNGIDCGVFTIMVIITRGQYAPGLCVRVRLLCVCVWIYVCVSSKNRPVCVLQLENLHENTLCSFFTEFIVL